jgi:hypothetical protein
MGNDLALKLPPLIGAFNDVPGWGEIPAIELGNRCSIRLSYGTNYGFLGCLGFVYRGLRV